MATRLSPKMREVLVYLDGCERASLGAIKRSTGANINTVEALCDREMVVFHPSYRGSWVITPLGRGHARDAA